MSHETIRCRESFDGQVLEIRLSTPPANVLSEKMMREIGSVLEAERPGGSRKLIVFAAEGRHFSFGASVEEHLPGSVNRMLPAFHRLMRELVEHPLPTLARVQGMCLGGAFELALCCSMIHAEEGAKFAVPEIQLGVFPPVAAALLPALLPSTLAQEMILSGDRYAAGFLHERGLIGRVFEAGKLEAESDAWIAAQLLPRSASSLRIAHRATRRLAAGVLRAELETLERLYLGELMVSADAVEGIRSFVEKRAPAWRNA